MKYYYKKSSYFVQWAFLVLFNALLIAISYFTGTSEKTMIKLIFGSCGLLLVFFSRYTGEYMNKYVELQHESIRFNSFILKNAGKTRSISYTIRYEDVISIECRTFPVIGLWAIYVNGKNLPSKVPITLSFQKHKELCNDLCKKVKERNPNAYIDSRLAKYCEE